MTAPNGWAADPSWQRFNIWWYLVWPGWALGWLLVYALVAFDLIPVDMRIVAAIILPTVAVVQFFRSFTLPQKTFERFRVAILREHEPGTNSVRVREAFRMSANTLALQTLTLVLIYGLTLWVNSPKLSSSGLISMLLWNPWMWASRGMIERLERESSPFRLQRVPISDPQ